MCKLVDIDWIATTTLIKIDWFAKLLADRSVLTHLNSDVIQFL